MIRQTTTKMVPSGYLNTVNLNNETMTCFLGQIPYYSADILQIQSTYTLIHKPIIVDNLTLSTSIVKQWHVGLARSHIFNGHIANSIDIHIHS